jgi:hypothetical protein
MEHLDGLAHSIWDLRMKLFLEKADYLNTRALSCKRLYCGTIYNSMEETRVASPISGSATSPHVNPRDWL